MKALRMLVLMLAVGVFPVFLMQAHGQQEVDPDHFDQPLAAKQSAEKLKNSVFGMTQNVSEN